MSDEAETAEAEFDAALAVAEKHLGAAIKEAGELGDFVAVAMIEAAVNAAVEIAGEMDIASILRDLADQIEGGADDEDDDE